LLELLSFLGADSTSSNYTTRPILPVRSRKLLRFSWRVLASPCFSALPPAVFCRREQVLYRQYFQHVCKCSLQAESRLEKREFFVRVDLTPLEIEEVDKVVVRLSLVIPSVVSSVVVEKQEVARAALMAKVEGGEAFVVSL